MSKAGNKKSPDFADRIPTLTEIVSRPEPLLDPPPPIVAESAAKAAKTPPAKTAELPKDLPETVERMVYKALYRQLPTLSKEIGVEIVSALEKQLLGKKSR
jgi:hypothetical protein